MSVVLVVHYEYDTLNRRVSRWIDWDDDGNSDFTENFIYDEDDVVMDPFGIPRIPSTRLMRLPAAAERLMRPKSPP